MKIYLTTEFNISTLSFQIHPVKWDVKLLGESDPSVSKNIPGHSVDEEGRDTWTVEICIDNGRIKNWPHGVDAEVSLFDPEGVYLIEDEDGNSITYIGVPPECLRILDDRDLSFSISENGYIEDWKISIDLLKEWGTSAKLTNAL
jgi:hypothetical protein